MHQAPSEESSVTGVKLFTVGHSTRPIDEFIALLKAHGVRMVVDVRTVPRSRRNPQYGIDILPQSAGGRGHCLYPHAFAGRTAPAEDRFAERGLAKRVLSGICRLHADA